MPSEDWIPIGLIWLVLALTWVLVFRVLRDR